MKITHLNKMRDLSRIGVLVNLDPEFLNKVKAYDCPKFIDKVKIKHRNEIELQYLIQTWDLSDNQKLLNLTAKAYGLNPEKINSYPLIDFVRLTIDLQEVAEESAKMFMTLKRESKDSEIAGVLEEFSTTGNLGIIDRFVTRSNGAYTHETAAKTQWIIVYNAFLNDTIEYDKQIAINEIMEKRQNDRTKQF